MEAEKIRERNIDRLKLLGQFELQQQVFNDPNLTYIKYGEKQEEDVNNRLQKIDKKLYYMLNPDTERIQMPNKNTVNNHIPYTLTSPFDQTISHAPASGQISNPFYTLPSTELGELDSSTVLF